MAFHIIDEAKRCIKCKTPKCINGCPIHTQIPEMIRMLLNGQIDEAGKKLFENNPLSLVCSFVCNHENQCEGNCVLNKMGKAIHVSSIENYISDYYFNLATEKYEGPKKDKIAIIGSGPAGLTIAILLAQKGYDITLFEAREKIGGVLQYGIPEFRLPKATLDRYKEKLVSLGIKIRPNTIIGPGGLVMDDLFRDGYKAVSIGTGMWQPQSLSIKGESLGHVHFAINYLKSPDIYDLGGEVIIIGAGNTAMDVARTAIRKGVRKVTVFFVMGEEQMTASRTEIEYAMVEGIHFEYFKKPIEITDEGVVFADTTFEGEELVEIPNTTKLYHADSVIVAISQKPRSYITSTTHGIDSNEKGLLVTGEGGQTTREGVFASGDVVSGARTVVEAVEYSKKVAEMIDKYCSEN